MNGSVKLLAEHEFIERLATEVRAGFGLVPFVGSGCSSQSGILMGEQFTDYLAWTVYSCVADRSPYRKAAATRPPAHWNLRQKGWPRPPSHTDVDFARAWVLDQFDTLARECGLEIRSNEGAQFDRVSGLAPRPSGKTPDSLGHLLYAPLVPPFLRDPGPRVADTIDVDNLRLLHAALGGRGLLHGGFVRPRVSPTSKDAITERAIRSLYDWRATLRFLSELKLADDEQTLSLVEPGQAVIDGFNAHVTRGRRPNLIHTMLCHLRQPARMRLILTTNFDTLIEDAFSEQHRRIEVISVSVKGELPDPEIVHARDTVVKLHGTLTETRADFSLDETPSLDDRRRFFHYVRGGLPDESKNRLIPAHLLVAGYSGSDARGVQLMKFVLDGDPEAMIFWICNNPRDERRVEQLFGERAYRDRVLVTTTARADLLLFEFYQHLNLSLPPGGSSYPINHNVPPLSSFRPGVRDDEWNEGCEKIMEAATLPSPGTRSVAPRRPSLRGPKSRVARLAPFRGAFGRRTRQLKRSKAVSDVVMRTLGVAPLRPNLLILDSSSGMLAALRGAFDRLAHQHGLKKIWLELDDHAGTGGLAYELFQNIALSQGMFQLGHAHLCPDDLCEPLPSTSARSARAAMKKRVANWTTHIKLLVGHFGIEPKLWLISLYGRNGPGICDGWDEGSFWEEALPSQQGLEYSADKGGFGAGVFEAFLAALLRAGFNVLYAPYTEARRATDKRRRREIETVLLEPERWRSEDARQVIQETIEEHFPVAKRVHREQHFKRLAAWKLIRFQWVTLDKPQIETPTAEHPQRIAQPPHGTGRLSTVVAVPETIDSSHSQAPSSYAKAMKKLLECVTSMKTPTAAEPLNESKSPPARLWCSVIYGASLFRQSRHYTAFLNEGVFPCPHRFNAYGQDNDLIRRSELEPVLAVLNRRPRVFRRKPGGFAWAHRDMRLGMRCIVDAATRLAEKFDEPTSLRPCHKRRALTHFWIGDWYFRAFQVSSHANPLAEALYHYYQAILHSRHGRSTTIGLRAFRRLIWRLSVVQLTRALRRGGDALRFWLGRPQLRHWFGAQSYPRLLGEIRAARQAIDSELEGASVDPLESAEDERLITSLAEEFRQLSLRGTKSYQTRIADFDAAFAAPTRTDDFRPTLLTSRATDSTQSSADEQDDIEPELDVDDPRWWQWNGRRPALPAAAALLEHTQGGVDTGKAWPTRAELTRFEIEHLHGPSANIALLVQHFTEWTFQLLSRSKREQAASSDKTDSPDTLTMPMGVRRQWARVCTFAQVAIDACYLLPPSLDEFGVRESAKAYTMYGLALGRLQRFYEAHRRFNHAHGLLGNRHDVPSLIALGILDLRRAETYLMEAKLASELIELAGRITLNPTDDSRAGDEPSELSKLTRDLLQCRMPVDVALLDDMGEERTLLEAEQVEQRAAAVSQWLDVQIQSLSGSADQRANLPRHLSRLVVARCDDAWGCLEGAELLLAGRTHSSHWWSLLRALKLLAFATCPPSVGYAESRYRQLFERTRHDRRTTLQTIWRDGLSAAPRDDHSALLLLDYYSQALQVAGFDAEPALSVEVTRIRQRLAAARGAGVSRAAVPPTTQWLSDKHLLRIENRLR